jgi:hypothetical protein
MTCAPVHGLREYKFDRVFEGDISQVMVYQTLQKVIGEFVNGVNGSFLCYGQTGTISTTRNY